MRAFELALRRATAMRALGVVPMKVPMKVPIEVPMKCRRGRHMRLGGSEDAREGSRRARRDALEGYVPGGALADLRAALEIIEPVAQRGSSEAGRLAEEMMAAYRQAERDKHAHENNRDHAKMLDLPENLHELEGAPMRNS